MKHRISKGLGIINQIFNILGNVNFGSYQFEIAMLLRESMLLNGILTNVEIWYNLTKAEIEEFESLDRLFLRRLLEVPASTPCESYYLELGVLPISAGIKARRMNYLQTILRSDRQEILNSFFITLWLNPCKGDWRKQL